MSEIALLGKKIGMTREFYKSGQLVPVTVLKMEKARVIQVIDKEKRGYTAVQLGYGKIKNSKLTKAMKGYFSKKHEIVFSSTKALDLEALLNQIKLSYLEINSLEDLANFRLLTLPKTSLFLKTIRIKSNNSSVSQKPDV